MSRRRPQQSHGVQLFPFLDVLLSAMGALILLLAVASRNLTRQEAQLAADLPTAEELRIRSEMVDWEVEQLRIQRDKTAADLAHQRLTLGHLEQHARRLRDEVNELALARQQLSLPPSESDGRAADQLRELESRIAAARHALERSLADNAFREPSYAIVPYQGPNETHRRPIYIECRDSEILLQPEGVVLTLSDLDGPLGPGNPLAAAVRAAREHLSRLRSSSAGDASEPYPLLLVRPDGIEMFYAARAALDSWGSEFGYEFIEQDWKIDYQQADPELAALEQDAVDTARQQQSLVAQLAPRIQRSGSARTYRASKTGGGIVAEDGGDDFGSRGGGRRGRPWGTDDPYGPPGGFSDRRGERGAGSGEGWATAAERAGAPDGGYVPGGSPGNLVESQPGYGSGPSAAAAVVGGSSLTAPYRAALENARARAAASALGDAGNRLGSGGQAGAPGSHNDPLAAGSATTVGQRTGNAVGAVAGTAAAGVSQGSPTGDSQFGGIATGSSSGNDASAEGLAASSSVNSSPASPGATAAADAAAGANARPTAGTTSSPLGGAGSPAGGSPSDPLVTPGLSSVGAQFGATPQQQAQQATEDRQRRGEDAPRGPFDTAGRPRGNYAQSPAGRGRSSHRGHSHISQRGENWALPESAPSSVPLSRPIRVECHQDRITIYSDRGRAVASRVVELGPNTEDSLNELVSAIWDHMEGWGIAGDGFYWHPILNLHVAPDGEVRASELKALLAGSGLEIRDPRVSSARRPAARPGEATR